MSQLIEKRLTVLAVVLGVTIGISFSLSLQFEFFSNLTAELIGISFTFILLEMYLKYEERKKWSIIEIRVKDLFDKQMKELLLDLSLFCRLIGSVPDIDLKTGEDDQDIINSIFERFDKKLINIIMALSDDRKLIMDSLDINIIYQFRGRFKKHYDLLNNFEIKYSSYLSPHILAELVTIENEVKNILSDAENMEYRASDEMFLFAMSFYIHRIMKSTRVLLDEDFLRFKNYKIHRETVLDVTNIKNSIKHNVEVIVDKEKSFADVMKQKFNI